MIPHAKRDEARRLRERGWEYRRIAERFGVSNSTVFRWVNPDFEEDQRRKSLDAKRRRKSPCPECGALVDYTRPAGSLCQSCLHEAEFGERNRRILKAWEQGMTGSEIGAREGMPETNVNSLIQTWRTRADNGEGPSLHTLPHSNSEERQAEIARLWNAGAGAKEIAEQLGTTEGSIYFMVYRARKHGVEIEARSGPRYDHDLIVELWNKGWTAQQIADRLDTDATAIHAVVHRLRKRGYDLERRRSNPQAAGRRKRVS